MRTLVDDRNAKDFCSYEEHVMTFQANFFFFRNHHPTVKGILRLNTSKLDAIKAVDPKIDLQLGQTRHCRPMIVTKQVKKKQSWGKNRSMTERSIKKKSRPSIKIIT